MSEPTPPTAGRTRRRASRRAGPVDAHDQVDGIAGESAAVTAERADTGTAAISAEAKADTKADTKSQVTTKAAAAPVDATESSTADKASTVDAEQTAKLDSAPKKDISAAAKPDDSKAKAAEPVDADTDPSETPASRTLRPLEWAAVAVAAISLIALIVTGVFYVHHNNSAEALSSQRAQYVQTAKQAILNLTNIKDDTAQQDIDRVLSVASGDLKAEYSQQKDAYAQVVQQAKVKASGQVIEAGIESQGDDVATVLVAAKQTLTNAGDAQPQDRYYRFRVTVNRADDGTVTASKVEFVA